VHFAASRHSGGGFYGVDRCGFWKGFGFEEGWIRTHKKISALHSGASEERHMVALGYRQKTLLLRRSPRLQANDEKSKLPGSDGTQDFGIAILNFLNIPFSKTV
jgi:hypothetical protein